ncbi:general amidase GmdB [Leptodontidium sp. MPI-SDFR-AT-0119]|nr:general amidase GmdB [Leptodontidium sp. MPI-SDFR-AT-0119]
MPPKTSKAWENVAAKKQAECLAAIPSAWIIPPAVLKDIPLGPTSDTNVVTLDIPRKSGILSDSELAITEKYNATELAAKLVAGEFSSEEVTVAFSKRAAIAQQLVNCLTETFFDRAVERAKFLDAYLKKHGKPMGPLHGLPISLKESFNLEGIRTTIGYISYADNSPLTYNSALVDMLLDLGAVLYVKTNIPQAFMSADTHNNLFGRTLNPNNLSLGAGGSTGGEGALIALRGSVLGVGTDLGGSIRMPSLACGIIGFKPSTGRIPYARKCSGVLGGFSTVLPCAGPNCTDLADAEFFMRTVIDANPYEYDSSAYEVPWRSIKHEAGKKLTIGVPAEDPLFPLQPPVRRALSSAVAKLKEAGHTLIDIPYNPDNSIATANGMMMKYYQADPDRTQLKNLEEGGEPLVPSVINMNCLGTAGDWTELSLAGLAAMNRQRGEMIEAWRKVWVDKKLDVLLGPGCQSTAVKHDAYSYIPYTTQWNLMDFPAVVFPYMKSSKELDPEPRVYTAPQKGPDYDPVLQDGAPCSIQITARRFQDEKCLAAARIIEEALRG